MNVRPYYFSHARTAFKYGLEYIGLKKKDSILVPDYICDVLLHPLKELKINYKYYSIKDDLTPEWNELENLIGEKTKAVLMIHYFGQPQNVEKFQNFCDVYGLKLIEDNAHGYGGIYRKKLLGTYGDIGFSSPRKIVNVFSGGILFCNKGNLDIPIKLNPYPISFSCRVKKLIGSFPMIKFAIKKYLYKRPQYEDPRAFKEDLIDDYTIDNVSKNILLNTNLLEMRSARQKSYQEWYYFALENGLKPVFNKLHSEANPWCFPAYTRDQNESKKWYNWGWKYNRHVFTWPSLPEEIINLNGSALERHQRLVCFSIRNKI